MLRRFNRFVRQGKRITVMGTENEQTETVGAVLFQYLLDADDISQRFTHLFFTKLEKSIVHPYPGKRLFAGVTFRLRDLIFVVGEN